MAEYIKKIELNRSFETSFQWILFTLIVSFIALFVHSAGQTMLFTHGYFEEPNLYHTWDRFDEITHPLSSCAITSIILNFNLPLTFRKKWGIALILGMIGGIIWEFLEFIVAPLGIVQISFTDTLLDLHQDFYGSAFAVLSYILVMRESSIISPRMKFKL